MRLMRVKFQEGCDIVLVEQKGHDELRIACFLRKALFCLFACFFLTLQSTFALANDTFPGTVISGSGSLASSNADATAEAGEPIAGPNPAFPPLNTMWYSWTAPSNGTLVVQTCGSTVTSFDTALGIYTGSTVGGLTQLAFNDDANNCSIATSVSYGSSITLDVTAGTTYQIQVDGYGSAVGAFLLQYSFTPVSSVIVLVPDSSATEGGDTANFQVRLGSAPTGNVTVNIAADASGQCTFAPTSLTFTTTNWNVLQQVIATAVNDIVAEGTHSCSTGAITATGGGLPAGTTGTAPAFIITDNDTAALIILNTDSTISEAGNTGTFTVRLATAPSANVSVTIGTSPQCTFATSPLTFTTANWNTNQLVTVTAINDTVVEGAHSCVTGAIAASGGGYTGVTGTAQTFTITDNDTGAITVATTTATATEGGANGAFTIVLTAQPASNVTVTVGADAAGQCTFAPTTLTFTNANWNAVQTVVTTAVNDLLVEGAHACTTGAIAASGSGYTGVTGTAPSFTITDNDTGLITIVKTIGTATEGGANGAFTIVLTAQPVSNVTVTIGADAAGQCTFAPTTLTFTNANWNAAQSVATTAVNDLLVEGAHACTTGAIAASGSGYTGVSGTAPSFTITDNDLASVTLNKTAGVASVSTAGAVISYSIKITNTGNVNATGLTVSDTLVPVTCPTSGTNTIATLTPSSFETCTASYSANQTDFDTNGGGDADIDNSASVNGSSGGVSVAATGALAVLCPQNSSLTIVKTANKTGPLQIGEIITYSFIARNTGNVTLSDISVEELSFNGAAPPLGTPVMETLTDNAPLNTPAQQSTDVSANNGVWSVLKPNDEVTFKLSYTVTQNDVDLIQ
jgi:large repetitive protein